MNIWYTCVHSRKKKHLGCSKGLYMLLQLNQWFPVIINEWCGDDWNNFLKEHRGHCKGFLCGVSIEAMASCYFTEPGGCINKWHLCSFAYISKAIVFHICKWFFPFSYKEYLQYNKLSDSLPLTKGTRVGSWRRWKDREGSQVVPASFVSFRF